jgi:hypothetical protein
MCCVLTGRGAPPKHPACGMRLGDGATPAPPRAPPPPRAPEKRVMSNRLKGFRVSPGSGELLQLHTDTHVADCAYRFAVILYLWTINVAATTSYVGHRMSVDVFKDLRFGCYLISVIKCYSGDALIRDRRCVTQPTRRLLYYWPSTGAQSATARTPPLICVNEPYCRLRTCAHAVSDPINM